MCVCVREREREEGVCVCVIFGQNHDSSDAGLQG